METVETHGTFEEAIAGGGETPRAIARKLREVIAAVYPDAVEVPWPNQGIVGYGVGPKKTTEHFCYVAPFATHANLGFNHGVNLEGLEDPDDLLEGEGKEYRHVRMIAPEEADRPAIRALIEAAVEERERALAAD